MLLKSNSIRSLTFGPQKLRHAVQNLESTVAYGFRIDVDQEEEAIRIVNQLDTQVWSTDEKLSIYIMFCLFSTYLETQKKFKQ